MHSLRPISPARRRHSHGPLYLSILLLLGIGSAALFSHWSGTASSAPPWRSAPPIHESGSLDLSHLLNASNLGFSGRLEPTGPIAVWSIGPESQVPSLILQPRPMQLLLELLPAPGTRALPITVSWNGHVLHTGNYLEGRWHTIQLQIPPELQLLGQNWLRLRQGGPGTPNQRRAAYRKMELRPLQAPTQPLALHQSAVLLPVADWQVPHAPPEAKQVVFQTDTGFVQPGTSLQAEALQAIVLQPADQPQPTLTLRRDEPLPLPHYQSPWPPARDAVLILLDACRADALGAYGDPSGSTPHLDRIARQGRIRSRTFAVASYTLASVGTLLSGLPSLRNGLFDQTKRLPDTLETFPEALQKAGFQSAAFSASPFVTRHFGLDQGFVVFQEMHDDRDYIQGGRNAATLVTHFERWLDTIPANARLFAYLHLREPHQPYDPQPPWDQVYLPENSSTAGGGNRWIEGLEANGLTARQDDIDRIRGFYRGGLASVDAQVGRMVQLLQHSGRLEQTMLTIVSDHGEAFFEHQKMTHNTTVHDEMVRIPWLTWVQGHPEHTIDDTLAGTADIAPALGSALGVYFQPMPEPDLTEPVAVTSHTSSKFSGLRTGPWAYVENKQGDGGRLFQVLQDPAESRELSRRRPVTRTALALRLQEILTADQSARERLGQVEAAPLDPAAQEEIKALGYIE